MFFYDVASNGPAHVAVGELRRSRLTVEGLDLSGEQVSLLSAPAALTTSPSPATPDSPDATVLDSLLAAPSDTQLLEPLIRI